MKVNILMATYNGQDFVGEQIESIQNQSFQDWTLLIRDDGSSDRTRDIIQAYAQKDSRIRLINPDSLQNLGVINSFYHLVKYETADVYFFSDQDDIWLPEKLEKTLAATASKDPSRPLLVYTDLKVVDKELNTLHESMIKTQSHHANTSLLQELTENTVTGGTMMINRELADKWTVTQDILMHDWYLALLASAFGELVYLDFPTELYRQHEANVLGARTWSKRVKNWLQPHKLVSKYWSLISQSQKQAKHLLSLDLSSENKELVEAFVTIMDQSLAQRLKSLRNYGFAKNRTFHTLVFRTLIITKFGYRRT